MICSRIKTQIAEARVKKHVLCTRFGGTWFTPDELEQELYDDYSGYHTWNFEVRDPEERTTALVEAIDDASEELHLWRERLRTV